jgi:hypothetical protein
MYLVMEVSTLTTRLRRLYQRWLVVIGWDFDEEAYQESCRQSWIRAFSAYEGTSHCGGRTKA